MEPSTYLYRSQTQNTIKLNKMYVCVFIDKMRENVSVSPPFNQNPPLLFLRRGNPCMEKDYMSLQFVFFFIIIPSSKYSL